MARVEWLLVCATLLFGSPARAQATGADIATAQALFDEGKRQMQAGRFDEACPKLVESQRLDPGGGTLLAIALCHEGQGRPATAWGDFNVALSEARKDRRADRESAALDHIRALEQKMPRARIVGETKVDGLEILRDGAPVGQAQWGTALPIDPGEHRFEARAPGKTAWTSTIAIADAARTTDVSVPPLADAPAVVAPPPPPIASVPASPPPRAPTTAADTSNPTRTWGFVTGGVAIAAVGVGAVFGLSASSKWKDAERSCVGGRCTDPAAPQLATDAGHAADLSTVFVTVGAAGLVTSVLLFVLAPSDHPSAATANLHASPMFGRASGLVLSGEL